MGDSYCFSWFHWFCTDNALKKHESFWGNHNYCYVDMPEKNKNILKHCSGEKSRKAPFLINEDLECLLKKEQSCQNNPKSSYTERKTRHEPLSYSDLICFLDKTKHQHYYYRGKDCIENFCKKLKEIGTGIINYEEKQMIPLTDEKMSHINSKRMPNM